MQSGEMGAIIISLLESSAAGLEQVMKDFKSNNTPVTPQTFTIDVKYVWMVDFTLKSTTSVKGSGSFMGWGLSVSEQLSLGSEDKQTFTVEVKATLVPIAPPATS